MNERCSALFGRVVVTMALLLVAPSCSESKDEPPTNAVDASVEDAAASDVDAAPTEADVAAGPSDRELLLACEVEEPCPKSSSQLVDRRPSLVTPSTVCLLEGLQERKPGRYLHETNSGHGQGGEGVAHVLIVRADGTALYARMKHVNVRGSVSSEMSETSEPAQLCTLRDPSYFAECAAAVRQVKDRETVPDVPWKCAFGEGDTTPGDLKWFERCESAAATCE